MCLQCHSGLSDSIVLEQLKESLDNPNFKVWNETSISHVSLAAIGVNGKEAQKVGRQLLINYIMWKRENKNPADGTFFGNPTVEYVKEVLDNVNNSVQKFKDERLSYEQIKQRIFQQLH